MSDISILLGLIKYEPPKDRYEHLRKINDYRKDIRFNQVQEIMRDMIMSTSDLAYRLKINRDSAARYMSKLRRENKAETVGKTIHPGFSAKVDVWRLI